MTQLLRRLYQEGAIGRLAAFGVYRRAKKTFNFLLLTLSIINSNIHSLSCMLPWVKTLSTATRSARSTEAGVV